MQPIASLPVRVVVGAVGEEVQVRMPSVPSSMSLVRLICCVHEAVALVAAAGDDAPVALSDLVLSDEPSQMGGLVEPKRLRVQLPTRGRGVRASSHGGTHAVVLVLFTTALKTAMQVDEERRLAALLEASSWEWWICYVDVPSLGDAHQPCDAFASSAQDFASLPLPQLHVGRLRHGKLILCDSGRGR